MQSLQSLFDLHMEAKLEGLKNEFRKEWLALTDNKGNIIPRLLSKRLVVLKVAAGATVEESLSELLDRLRAKARNKSSKRWDILRAALISAKRAPTALSDVSVRRISTLGLVASATLAAPQATHWLGSGSNIMLSLQAIQYVSEVDTWLVCSDVSEATQTALHRHGAQLVVRACSAELWHNPTHHTPRRVDMRLFQPTLGGLSERAVSSTYAPVLLAHPASERPSLAALVSHHSEDAVDNTGNICVWPTEEVMLAYFLLQPELLQHKSVCEIGSGATGTPHHTSPYARDTQSA